MSRGRPVVKPEAVAVLYGAALRAPILRSHVLARCFADRVPVIYLPYNSASSWWMDARRFPPWVPLAAHPNVALLPMPVTTGFARRSGLVADAHAALGARRLRRAMDRLGLREEQTLLFLESAAAVGVTRFFPRAPVMYDCADDLRNWYGSSPRMNRLYQEMEEEIADRAEWVVVTIPRLMERFEGGAAEVSVGLNGVDLDAFRTPAPVPADIAHLPRPWLVYMGVVSPFVDPELIESLSRQKLGSILLVGPGAPRSPLRRLVTLPRVHWLGRKPYEALAAYIQHADVALIPGTNGLASDRIPSKLFMYCAAGVPVVATRCSSLEPYGSAIRLASSPDTFAEAVRDALADPGWGRTERIALAQENSWSRHADELLRRAGFAAAEERA